MINQYVGLFVVKRGGSFRVTSLFGAPFYDPDVGLLFYACAPFIVRKGLTFRPWPQVRVATVRACGTSVQPQTLN